MMLQKVRIAETYDMAMLSYQNINRSNRTQRKKIRSGVSWEKSKKIYFLSDSE